MHKFFIVSLSVLFISTPVAAAENLNSQLIKAVCRQQWWRAVRVVDRMTAESEPQYRKQLLAYRTRLVRIARSRVSVMSPECGRDGLPRSGLPGIQLTPSQYRPPEWCLTRTILTWWSLPSKFIDDGVAIALCQPIQKGDRLFSPNPKQVTLHQYRCPRMPQSVHQGCIYKLHTDAWFQKVSLWERFPLPI